MSNEGHHKVLARDATGVFVYAAKCAQCNTRDNLMIYTWEMKTKPAHLLTNVSVMCQTHGNLLLKNITQPNRIK